MTTCHISLPYPPSVNHIWRVGKGGRVHKSKEATAWANDAAWLVKASGVKVIGPYILSVIVHRPDKRRRDLDNLAKALNDSLQAGGAIEDDCLCVASLWRWAGTGVGLNMHGGAMQLPIISVEVGNAKA